MARKYKRDSSGRFAGGGGGMGGALSKGMKSAAKKVQKFTGSETGSRLLRKGSAYVKVYNAASSAGISHNTSKAFAKAAFRMQT